MSEPARIDKELVVLVGRNRENPRTHREAFEITGGLGEMLDKHIKRNNLNKSEFIREAVAAKLEVEMQNDLPLIKDEKIRKAVRAWAEACGLSYVTYKQASNEFYDPDTRGAFAIKFKLIPVEVYLEDGECYTIAELCGEEEE